MHRSRSITILIGPPSRSAARSRSVELDPQLTRRPEPSRIDRWRGDPLVGVELRSRVLHHVHHPGARDDRLLTRHRVSHAEVLTDAEPEVALLLVPIAAGSVLPTH